MGKMGKGEREVQASSDAMNKSWGCKVQHGKYSQRYRNSVAR